MDLNENQRQCILLLEKCFCVEGSAKGRSLRPLDSFQKQREAESYQNINKIQERRNSELNLTLGTKTENSELNSTLGGKRKLQLALPPLTQGCGYCPLGRRSGRKTPAVSAGGAASGRRRGVRRRRQQSRQQRSELLQLGAERRRHALQSERGRCLLQIVPERPLRGPTAFALDEAEVERPDPQRRRSACPYRRGRAACRRAGAEYLRANVPLQRPSLRLR